MKRWDRKKRDRNEKGTIYRWHAISFSKDALWSLNFKITQNIQFQYLNIFSIQFCQKILFCYFLVPGWEKRERGCRIPMVEREKCRWHRFRLPKWTIFVSNSSIWWEDFILDVFVSLKFMKNRSELRLIFGFGFISIFEVVFWGHR